MFKFVQRVYKLLHLVEDAFAISKEGDSIVVVMENGQSYRITIEEV